LRTNWGIILPALACAISTFAATPIGKISATEGVSVAGAAVSFRGIPAWPIVGGDEIRTSAAGATLMLSDGSQFRIAPNSVVRVEDSGGKQTVRVTEGSMHVAKASSHTSVASRKGIVPAERGVLRAEAATVANEPAAVEPAVTRYDLPAPSRRR
jgi:ferric-dicitrate binding protein FerR (iron transport regulator)